jgi:hypothetical protein
MYLKLILCQMSPIHSINDVGLYFKIHFNNIILYKLLGIPTKILYATLIYVSSGFS